MTERKFLQLFNQKRTGQYRCNTRGKAPMWLEANTSNMWAAALYDQGVRQTEQNVTAKAVPHLS
jgi:hypothetical protein